MIPAAEDPCFSSVEGFVCFSVNRDSHWANNLLHIEAVLYLRRMAFLGVFHETVLAIGVAVNEDNGWNVPVRLYHSGVGIGTFGSRKA